MCLNRTLPPPFADGQSHIGEADAVKFYYARIPLKQMHAINDHLTHCPKCDDFYAAWREREDERRMIGQGDGGICDEILSDQAEDAATRDHERRVRGEDVAVAEVEDPATGKHITGYVGSDDEGYVWITAWMDLESVDDHIEIQVWQSLLNRTANRSIDAETARTVARYLFEAAHNLDLRAKERAEETA